MVFSDFFSSDEVYLWFHSTDAGSSWKLLSSELKNLAAVAINPKNPSHIYVSTLDGTIYVSGDAGMKWAKQP